jgi:hypothetical protein
MAFATVVGYGFVKSNREKHAVEKAEDRLVQQLWLLRQMLNGPRMSSIAQISLFLSYTDVWAPLVSFFLILFQVHARGGTGRQVAIRRGWSHRPSRQAASPGGGGRTAH